MRYASAPSRARIGAQRALQVVDERKQLFDQVGGRRLRQRLALALGALAEVVELRGLAQQEVLYSSRCRSAAELRQARCRRPRTGSSQPGSTAGPSRASAAEPSLRGLGCLLEVLGMFRHDYPSLLPTIRLIACDSVSTALIAREYRIRVGPMTPTAPVMRRPNTSRR